MRELWDREPFEISMWKYLCFKFKSFFSQCRALVNQCCHIFKDQDYSQRGDPNNMYFELAIKQLKKNFDIRFIMQQIERGIILQKVLLNRSQLEIMDIFDKYVLNSVALQNTKSSSSEINEESQLKSQRLQHKFNLNRLEEHI